VRTEDLNELAHFLADPEPEPRPAPVVMAKPNVEIGQRFGRRTVGRIEQFGPGAARAKVLRAITLAEPVIQ
jgi:hypothetical protein